MAYSHPLARLWLYSMIAAELGVALQCWQYSPEYSPSYVCVPSCAMRQLQPHTINPLPHTGRVIKVDEHDSAYGGCRI